VMVRLVDSQWLELDTLRSVLVKVTSQEVRVLALTLKDVLVVVRVAGEVAFDCFVEYNCPLTALPEQVVPM
jgi:propanediol dehydratase small subunit